jgi:hypothetical protein
VTTEPHNCITFESDHYDFNLKYSSWRRHNIAFLLRFTEFDNIVKYLSGLAPRQSTLRSNVSPTRSLVGYTVEVTAQRNAILDVILSREFLAVSGFKYLFKGHI